jgi:hypothetical protein
MVGVRGVCMMRGGFCPFNVGGFPVYLMAEIRIRRAGMEEAWSFRRRI